MNAEVIRGITIRALRGGDTEVVQAVFDRLGPRSRQLRFGGAKNVLLPGELEQLARVDGDHHVLVAYNGREPVGIARLVRDGREAEVAFAVADDWQGNGVGALLVDRLAADARAAGIVRVHCNARADNTPSLVLCRRLKSALPAAA
jgi:GNAT superfamily N-acetyltransferase